MTPILSHATRTLSPTLPGLARVAALRRRAAIALRRLRLPTQGPQEAYALSIDQLWFALAVLFALLSAGWILAGLSPALAPPTPPIPVL